MQPRYARYVLGVMVGINFLNYLDRYILPVVASKIQDEFHLSDTAIGGLGTAFLLVYAVSALPFGLWADRDAAGDLEVLAGGIEDAFAEMTKVATERGT